MPPYKFVFVYCLTFIFRRSIVPRSWKTPTPFVGISGGVKYAVDGHRAFNILVEDRIGKAAHQSPAIVFVDQNIHLGRTADRFNTRIDAAQKFLS